MNSPNDPHEALQRIAAAGLIPVITLDDPEHALPLADALVAGGITVVEIALRTTAGLAAIERLSTREDLLIGAGTVLSPEQLDRVLASGARFVISPGLDEELVRRCIQHSTLPLPGVATATEVQQALRLGLTAVKLFPADTLGGLSAVKALHGPFPDLRFLPSGGVNSENAADYLGHPAILAVSGSWMAPREAIAAQDWALITKRCAAAVAIATDSGRG